MTMLKRFGRKAAPAAWILFAAGSAAAAESGPYVGADLGAALYPKGAYDWRLAPGSVLSGNSQDTTDFAWSFRAGYRFSRIRPGGGLCQSRRLLGPATDRVNAAAGHGNMSF